MGLDMYLTAKRYLWNEKDKEVSKKINEIVGVETYEEEYFGKSSLRVKQICLDAMYWRKANAIHGWFVENCQGGRDECQETFVDRDKLIQLRDLCQSILDNPDSTGDTDLNPMQGPFFGSYEKDEWYYQDLKNTVEGLTKALSLPEDEYDFWYQASW